MRPVENYWDNARLNPPLRALGCPARGIRAGGAEWKDSLVACLETEGQRPGFECLEVLADRNEPQSPM